jgi:hypothetical protein
MDAAQDDDTAFAHRLQRYRYEVADRGEDDRRVHVRAGPFVGVSGPDAAEAAGERLRLGIARARKRVDRPPFELRDLGDDVRGSAKPVDGEPLGVTRHVQRAVAD